MFCRKIGWRLDIEIFVLDGFKKIVFKRGFKIGIYLRGFFWLNMYIKRSYEIF